MSLEKVAEQLQKIGHADRQIDALRKHDLRTVDGREERTAAMQQRTRQKRQLRAEADGRVADLYGKG